VREPSTRARTAIAAIALWVAGFEVLPWLHVALHDRLGHHHHDATGAMVFDHEHEHDGGHDAPLTIGRALDHGRHSLAHHDVAMKPPAMPMTSPLPFDRWWVFVAAVVSIEPRSLSPGRSVARSPPALPS
jgi:hypothetical protein